MVIAHIQEGIEFVNILQVPGQDFGLRHFSIKHDPPKGKLRL